MKKDKHQDSNPPLLTDELKEGLNDQPLTSDPDTPSKVKRSAKANAPVDLKKVSIQINQFGEIVKDVQTEHINAFLNENVPDKKFTEE